MKQNLFFLYEDLAVGPQLGASNDQIIDSFLDTVTNGYEGDHGIMSCDPPVHVQPCELVRSSVPPHTHSPSSTGQHSTTPSPVITHLSSQEANKIFTRYIVGALACRHPSEGGLLPAPVCSTGHTYLGT